MINESHAKLQILQLADRLEDASSNERLEAIQSLHQLAKSYGSLVGECSMNKLLDLLREHGSVDEYQDILDLIIRLLSKKDQMTATINAKLILSGNRNIDVFLDLLEHDDITVGVMTSQILSELHSLHGDLLETEIQNCPDGMNKLLRRLPDNSREEVRDESIGIVQKLTASNEIMKTNFVFNEGFEIIFRIIKYEGGAINSSLVVKDCLLICLHVLHESEVCQRLFYGMGIEWISALSDFFDPDILESAEQLDTKRDEDVDNKDIKNTVAKSLVWLENSRQVECSVLAMNALAASLRNICTQHQNMFSYSNATNSISSAMYWLARRGPSPLVASVLDFLYHVLSQNSLIANEIGSFLITISPNISGKTIPITAEAGVYRLGWKSTNPEDNVIYITLPYMLADQYIYLSAAWKPSNIGSNTSNDINQTKLSLFDVSSSEKFSQSCLQVFEAWLEADKSVCDLLIQYIVVAPPPTPEELELEEEANGTVETPKPLALMILNIILEGCQKIISSSLAIGGSNLDVIERAVNILTAIFSYGSNVAREIATVISLGHTSLKDLIQTGQYTSLSPTQSVLSYLIYICGRLSRVANNPSTISLLVSLLRLLATISCNCQVVAKHILDDPSNLFVLDLASTSSENTGVSSIVQIASTFFIGCCFKALQSNGSIQQSDNEEVDDILKSSKAFIKMIDSRIGLQRFNDILKRPLSTTSNSGNSNRFLKRHEFLFSNGFQSFYTLQIDIIRKGILLYYTSPTNSVGDSSLAPPEDIIQIQSARILDLESKLLQLTSADNSISLNDKSSELLIRISEMEKQLHFKDSEILSLANKIRENEQDMDAMNSLIEEQAHHINELEASKPQDHHQNSTSEISMSSSHIVEEVLALKGQIVALHEEKGKQLDSIKQLQRNVSLLEEEVAANKQIIIESNNKCKDLESRNSELTQKIWILQSEVKGVDTNLDVVMSMSCMNDLIDVSNNLKSRLTLAKDSQVSNELKLNRFEGKISIESINPCISSIITILESSLRNVEHLANELSDIMQSSPHNNSLPYISYVSSEATLERIDEISRYLIQDYVSLFEEKASISRILQNSENSLRDLQFEHQSLLAEVSTLKTSPVSDNYTSTSHVSVASSPISSHPNPSDDHLLLRENYDILLTNHKKLSESMMEMKNQLHIIKQERDDLNHLVENLNAKINDLTIDLNLLREDYRKLSDVNKELELLHQKLVVTNDSLNQQLQSINNSFIVKEKELESSHYTSDALITLERWMKTKYQHELGISSQLDNQQLSMLLLESLDKLAEKWDRFDSSPLVTPRKAKVQDEEDEIARTPHISFVDTPSKPLNQSDAMLQTPKSAIRSSSRIQHSGDKALWSTLSKKMTITMSSPSVKELAKLQSEYLKEKRKLQVLQEEHDDLLGLVAQQELELSIFRETLESSLGYEVLIAADQEVQSLALEKYGNYIDFRSH